MNIDTLSIGCIGCGNMGSAILFGLGKNKSLELMGYDTMPEQMAVLQGSGITAAKDIEHLVISSSTIILAVKPHLALPVLAQIAPLLTKDKVIISIAAGISIESMRKAVENKCAVVRCMPNTPALVGAGIFAFCFDDQKLDESRQEHILQFFRGIGMCIELEEHKFAAFSAFMGAGPAYAFYLMNSLVQAGVTLGFSRDDSRHMVEQLFDGCTTMAKNSAQNLTQLRDNVCSPAGLSIAGVNHMESEAVSGAIVDAVLAAHMRANEMEN